MKSSETGNLKHSPVKEELQQLELEDAIESLKELDRRIERIIRENKPAKSSKK
jgi:hypothetical protein